MALHVAVNGKFGANCKRRPITILDDPERVKKDLENERRIARIQQVREKSSHLARKIRQEVAAEKQRQLEKLEQIKQQELNTWRDNVLVKKHNDFRSAVFQVGAAHRAAKEETERLAANRKEKQEKMRKCRQRGSHVKPTTKVNFQRPIGAKDHEQLNVEGRATMGTQTPLPEEKENRLYAGRFNCDKQNCKESGPDSKSTKRKHATCCRESPNCLCVSSEDEELLGEISISSEEATSVDNPGHGVGVQSQPKSQTLHKNPPIVLAVDIESDEGPSLSINTKQPGMEINDRFMQTNRKFSHVVRSSPQTSPERTSNINRAPRFTQISDLVKRSEATRSTKSNLVTRETSHREIPASVPSKSPTRSPRKTIEVTATKSPTRAPATKSPNRATAPKSPAKTSRSGIGSPIKTSTTGQRSARQNTNSAKNAPVSSKIIDAGIKRISVTAKKVPVSEGGTTNLTAAPVAASNTPAPGMQTSPFIAMPPSAHPNQLQPFLVGYAPQHMQAMAGLPPFAMPYPLPVPINTNYPPPVAYQPVQQMVTQSQPEPPVPIKPPAPRTTRHHATATQSSLSTTTFVMREATRPAGPTQNNASSRVQFYDHNNKYHRNYEAPAQAVQFNPQDPTQLNAMDHARIENQLRELREQELDKLRKISDERGQKALEREQVRRDCAELTEKLDALTQQQPQLLPTDANLIPSHRFEDAAARRQDAMNEAMEQMLLRPAIITCPEVPTATNSTQKKNNLNDESVAINVGEPSGGLNGGASSESCCSILLDYVDGQSKQLKSDLKAAQSNSFKSQKLRNLLERIEKIRLQLIEELKAGDAASTTKSGNSAQQVIDAIRQERAHILSDKAKTLDERESDLQQKEAILEQRLRQFYKEQKEKRLKDGEKSSRLDDKPLEIIIKVKSDGTIKQYVPKHRSKVKAKVPQPKEKSIESTKPPEGGDPKEVPQKTDQRQISIDSNSTSYRSLPSVNYKNVEPATTTVSAAAAPLHPVIAHYVSRLLGMTRNSIQDLGVSSSDVPTPTPSVVNVSRNISVDAKADNTLLDNRRVERAQAFIEQNRSFINELEDTLRSQQQDKESSQRAIDEIWKKHLEYQLDEKQKKLTAELKKQERQQESKERPSTGRETTTKTKSVSLVSQVATNRATLNQQIVSNKSKSQSSSTQESASKQMERYAQLTENCTQRIAELTELITKVREEKQRLVEVTLTSASDGERHSTEYLELPAEQRHERQEHHQRSRTVSNGSDESPLTSEALPLQKNKPTAISRDSGISESRPLTAQGQVNAADAEPISLGSSTQSSYRRGKAPPITIRRYSPQLNADDLAHELSTITEVEMPTQSNLAAAVSTPIPFPSFEQYARELQLDLTQMDQDQSQRLEKEFNDLVQVINDRVGRADYREFPSITAYLHNVTATRLHVETDADITLAPNELMKQLRLANVNMQSFPSRREYIQQLLSGETPEQRELIDSASLENESSDSFNIEAELRQRQILKTSFHQENLDQQQEVASSTRRDSIPPQNTNDTPPNESGIEPLSSDLERDLQRLGMHWPTAMRQRQRQAAALGHSTSTSNPSPEPPPRTARGTINRSARKSKDLSDIQDASHLGRSLNLREFLTRELLKHRVQSGNSSIGSSDDSLKSNFLRSVLDSLSPSSLPHTPRLDNGTTTIDRQKTSTPVGSFVSAQEKSKSKSKSKSVSESSQNHGESQLFSGESGLSAVNYPDGTPPVPYERTKSPTEKSTQK